jgi:hypothetical protein
MKWQNMTMIFSFLLIAIIAIYDIWIMAKGGTESSISHMIIVASYKYPLVPFMFGIVCGHLFWRMRYTAETKKISDNTRE